MRNGFETQGSGCSNCNEERDTAAEKLEGALARDVCTGGCSIHRAAEHAVLERGARGVLLCWHINPRPRRLCGDAACTGCCSAAKQGLCGARLGATGSEGPRKPQLWEDSFTFPATSSGEAAARASPECEHRVSADGQHTSSSSELCLYVSSD